MEQKKISLKPFFIRVSALMVTFMLAAVILGYKSKNFYAVIILCVAASACMALVIFPFVSGLGKKLDEALNHIERLSITDDVTGLFNRRLFFFRLEDEMNRVRRYGNSLSLLLVDIDELKTINDTRGHDAGDLVLSTVGELVRNNCRKTDIICRYAGKEIAVILPLTEAVDAMAIAEKIRARVSEMGVRYDDFQTLRSTASIGVVTVDRAFLDTTGDAKGIIHSADLALTSAMNDGHDRVKHFSDIHAV